MDCSVLFFIATLLLQKTVANIFPRDYGTIILLPRTLVREQLVFIKTLHGPNRGCVVKHVALFSGSGCAMWSRSLLISWQQTLSLAVGMGTQWPQVRLEIVIMCTFYSVACGKEVSQ